MPITSLQGTSRPCVQPGCYTQSAESLDRMSLTVGDRHAPMLRARPARTNVARAWRHGRQLMRWAGSSSATTCSLASHPRSLIGNSLQLRGGTALA
jgi:hypothetical protein